MKEYLIKICCITGFSVDRLNRAFAKIVANPEKSDPGKQLVKRTGGVSCSVA